jgi:hypothetical protein
MDSSLLQSLFQVPAERVFGLITPQDRISSSASALMRAAYGPLVHRRTADGNHFARVRVLLFRTKRTLCRQDMYDMYDRWEYAADIGRNERYATLARALADGQAEVVRQCPIGMDPELLERLTGGDRLRVTVIAWTPRILQTLSPLLPGWAHYDVTADGGITTGCPSGSMHRAAMTMQYARRLPELDTDVLVYVAFGQQLFRHMNWPPRTGDQDRTVWLIDEAAGACDRLDGEFHSRRTSYCQDGFQVLDPPKSR